MDDKYDYLDCEHLEYILNYNNEIIWDSLMTMYILLMNKFKIIKDKETIDIFFYLYKNNYKILKDERTLGLINFNENNTTFEKYLILLIIIYNLNTEFLELVNFFNNSKLFKLNKNKISINSEIIYTDNIDNIHEIESAILEGIEDLQNYLTSYKIESLLICSFNEITINIIRDEIINRFILLKNMVGSGLLNLLLNRKTRKKYSFIEIYDEKYLSTMKYEELQDYIIIIFGRIRDNIKKIKTDIEFNKYLQLLFINYINNNTKNQITKKFYNKLIKKFLFF